MASLVKVLVHAVFSTKKRVPFIIRHKRATLLALGGMPDHIHALIRLKADLSLSDTLRALKAVSSKWVHEKPNPIPEFAWQEGYFAASVSASREAAVRS